MSGPGVLLGVEVGPFDTCLDGDMVRRYAAATNDTSPEVRAGRSVPTAAIATQIWDAQNEAREELVPAEMRRSGVHGEHDIVLHRAIEPGERLRTWVEGHGARPAGRNSSVVLRYVALDAADRLVAEQWWTTVYLGTSCEQVGSTAPEHSFPDIARSRPLGTQIVNVDIQMARRYAEVSGDWAPHHFDVEAARRSGSDRIFLHGLCTLALCARAVVAVVDGGDSSRLRRIAVRFAAPTPLGEDLSVGVYDTGGPGFAFEASSAGRTVITHGRAELW